MGDESEMVLSEAARELNLSHVSVWRFIQAGRLPARRVGPIWLVKRSDVEAFKIRERPIGRPRKPRPAAAEE